MPSNDTAQTLLDQIKDPVKILLWFEILKNPGITAKNLKQFVPKGGNSVYYHLKQLENSIIDVKLEQVPNSNLLQKKYYVSELFFDEKESGKLKEMAKKRPKDVMLFELYFMSSIINQYINRINKMSQEEFSRHTKAENSFGESFLINPNLVSNVEEYFTQVRKVSESDMSIGETLQLRIQNASHGIVFGCFPLK